MPAERTPPKEQKRTPRLSHAPYKKRQPKPAASDKTPKSSAQPASKKQRQNLTLFDWLTVLKFVKEHPNMSQDAIVKHFATRVEGALIFDQSTLSRKLREREKLEERAKSHPAALSCKNPRIVTRPDVERALFLWVKHMEQKRETVNGPMLIAKRARFEEKFNVPPEERLYGDGWVSNFTRAYNIKEYRRHGEAASVDLDAVEAERERIQARIARYAPKDRFNADETSFFAFAPPDRGLATEQMSGKKRDKFRITMMVACNADGSEKLPLLFIGKYKKPRCFGKRTPQAHGFYYRNNKSAWMTQVIFEEWLQQLDLEMARRSRNICLLVDNFTGHYVGYEPRNIEVIFFEPNLTSFVQPCDGGIIRTLKALYRKAFCLRAIDQDEAGEREIYKINLLEAMLLATRAWDDVDAKTIANCWKHTKIQPTDDSAHISAGNPLSHNVPLRTEGWNVIYTFAMSDDMSLPDAEKQLHAVLGDRYVASDWQGALEVVMNAENDVDLAIKGLDQLTTSLGINIHPSAPSAITSAIAPAPTEPRDLPENTQLAVAEEELENAVNALVARKRIIGSRLTLDEMLNPVEELEIGEGEYRFEEDTDGDSVNAIAHRVEHEMAVKRGEIIEIDDDDDDDEPVQELGIREVIGMCGSLEDYALRHASHETSLDLVQALRRFRIQLRKAEMENAKQSLLDYWIRK